MHTKVSGKPDAGEWAQQFIRNNTYCRSDWLTKALSDFQRETLLWAARHLGDRSEPSSEGDMWLSVFQKELERLA